MSIVPADGWVKDEAFYIVGTQYSYADTDAAPETTILLDVRFKFGQTDDAFIQSAYTENFDIVKDDFQKMLDSFTLQ